ncbi:MAG TPA: CoA transferase [Microthrixaceae bacterium]|nr:CoA transferase [Microthrixaceae bacterium]
MSGPLDGVRVVEVATHVFVPMAGAVLAEWGASVVKVEHPETGDPYRSLVTSGLHNLHKGFDPFFQSANRLKRSVGIDLRHPDGRDLLSRLVRGADVFTTSLRDGALRRLGLEVGQVRAENPRVIHVRGTAFGTNGPDASRGGYDTGAYWARSGMQHLFTAPDAPWPTPTRPAFGDLVGAMSLAGAVSAALYRRATTGVPTTVDSSLLASGMWQVQPDIVNARVGDDTHSRQPDRYTTWNPLMLPYRTADDRFVALMVLTPDRHWSSLCSLVGRPDLAADPRFADMGSRRANARACVETLEAVFAERPLDAWKAVLADFDGEWTVVQTPLETHDDPQVRANGYVAEVAMAEGVSLPMVTTPVRFDGRPGEPERAPELGEHTEEVLLELGLSWDEIAELKQARAIL